jgi:glutaminyl-tRNA synthetase
LVQGGHVTGWDDPRMPTLSGLRRRGVPPAAIRTFCERIGVSKRDSLVDVAMLEHAIREVLNPHTPRVMAVLHPLRLVIDNYPDGQVEQLDAVNNPEDATMGSRAVPFSRVLYIEQDDFRDDPPPKYFRLSPGREVRLRWAYIVRCEHVVRDAASGAIVEVHCTYDPTSRGGSPADGRKVKSTIHWVSAAHAVDAEVRLYDRLFDVEDPGGDDYVAHLNPRSLEVLREAKVEPSLRETVAGTTVQFERLGYFVTDPLDSSPGGLVFNRTVTLRDTWARIEQSQRQRP